MIFIMLFFSFYVKIKIRGGNVKKNSFSLIEIFAILLIIICIASIFIFGLPKSEKTEDDELLNLHASIENAYSNYKDNNENVQTDITISKETDQSFDNYLEDLSYNNETITKETFDGSTISYKILGDLLDTEKFPTYSKEEQKHITDKTCKLNISNECLKDENGNEVPSTNGIVCMKIVYRGKTIINDFEKKSSLNKLCTYWREVNE